MAYTLFGLLYVLWLYNFITKIVYVTPRTPNGAMTGQFYVFYCIAITKFSDMGAYLTGSLIGQHPLVPHISPKKTWEGFFGALAFSLLASVGLFALMPGHLSVLTWTHAVVLGLLLGFAAVIGDLAESIVKRSTGVKDSGNMLPGIGGALDLVDSLLFTAPLLFFYLRLVIRAAVMKRKRVVVLGATGSIGESALKVAHDIPDGWKSSGWRPGRIAEAGGAG